MRVMVGIALLFAVIALSALTATAQLVVHPSPEERLKSFEEEVRKAKWIMVDSGSTAPTGQKFATYVDGNYMVLYKNKVGTNVKLSGYERGLIKYQKVFGACTPDETTLTPFIELNQKVGSNAFIRRIAIEEDKEEEYKVIGVSLGKTILDYVCKNAKIFLYGK